MGAAVIPAPRWVAGVPIHPLRRDETVALIGRALERREPLTVMYANAHAIVMAQDDPTFRGDLRTADIVFCDGVGAWLGTCFLGEPLPERYTPPDWIEEVAALAARGGHRLFLLGAAPGVAERAAAELRGRFPALEVGAHHGYLDEAAAAASAGRALRDFRPDILLVGMGMPRQERWIIDHAGRHGATVTMAVGALFDYLAGETPRGPRWLTDRGLEWLARLWYEPKRLARRYLLGLPRFAWLLLRARAARRE